ncbi:MAG: hypothetical protein RLZZ308_121 [Candidatus Parcubacteria bacterium]|jgi:dTDP-4-dehydrorhamnose reductase
MSTPVRLLVLGHKGMLGNAVVKYFSSSPDKYTVVTLASRYGDSSFKFDIIALSPDYIINCIGKIPQKAPLKDEYKIINIELPRMLETLGIPIIHPTTDCEFKGNNNPHYRYSKQDKRDAEDEYGKSKAYIADEIEKGYRNTKMIRVSIIGHENTSHVSLLDWFLSQKEPVKGYGHHLWNGITTLEWSKRAEAIICSWDTFPILNQYGTEEVYSKYDMLLLFKEVYGVSTEIIYHLEDIYVNKTMISDDAVANLKDQLVELRDFYDK